MTYTLILFNLVGLVTAFIDLSNQEEKSQTIALDRYNAGRYNLEENDFEFIVALPWYIPPSIARVVILVESNNELTEW